MARIFSSFATVASTTVLSGLPLLLAAPGAWAQEGAASARTTRNATPNRALSDVLERISRAAGTTIVADSTVATASVRLPTEATTPANFEQQIADLVATLPKGTTWGRLYLPAPSGSRGYRGDDVAAYANAQARLFGRVGDAPEGMVEVMGKTLPVAQAEGVISTLGLKPVYLITNPTAPSAAMGQGQQANWSQMTPEQQQAYARTEAQRLMNMDPASRQQAMQNMMGQSRAVMGALMQSLTPEQRAQMFQGMGGMRVEGRRMRGPGAPRQ